MKKSHLMNSFRFDWGVVIMKCHTPELSKKQLETVRVECNKQFYELLDKFNRQASLQILHVLHFEYGFGQQRLEQFARRLTKVQNELHDRYEMSNNDTPWICEQQLKADRIDVDAILGCKQK